MSTSSLQPATPRRVSHPFLHSRCTYAMTENMRLTSEVYDSYDTSAAFRNGESYDASDLRGRSSQAFLHRRIAKRHTASRNFVEAITHHEASIQLVETLLTEKSVSPCVSRSLISLEAEKASHEDSKARPPAVAYSRSLPAHPGAHTSCGAHLTSQACSLDSRRTPSQASRPQDSSTHRLRMLLSAGLHDLAQIHSFLGDGESARNNLERAVNVLESSAQTDGTVKVYFRSLLKTLRVRHARGPNKPPTVGMQSNRHCDAHHENSVYGNSARNTHALCAPKGSAVTGTAASLHACARAVQAHRIGAAEPSKASGPWNVHPTCAESSRRRRNSSTLPPLSSSANNVCGENVYRNTICKSASSSARTLTRSRGSVSTDNAELSRRLGVSGLASFSTEEEGEISSYYKDTEGEATCNSSSQCIKSRLESHHRTYPSRFAAESHTSGVFQNSEASRLITARSRSACSTPCETAPTGCNVLEVAESVSSAVRRASESPAGMSRETYLSKSVTEATPSVDKAASSHFCDAENERLHPARKKENCCVPPGCSDQLQHASDSFSTEYSSVDICKSVSSNESDDQAGLHTVKNTDKRERHPQQESTSDSLPGIRADLYAAATPPLRRGDVACFIPTPTTLWKVRSVGASAPANRPDTAGASASICHFSGFADILKWRREAADAGPISTSSTGSNSSSNGSHNSTLAPLKRRDRRGSGITVKSTQQTAIVCTVEKCRCACLVSFYEDGTWQVRVCPVLAPSRQNVKHRSNVASRPHRQGLPCELRVTGTVTALSSSTRDVAVEKSPFREDTGLVKDAKSGVADVYSEEDSCGAVEFCASENA